MYCLAFAFWIDVLHMVYKGKGAIQVHRLGAQKMPPCCYGLPQNILVLVVYVQY